MAVRRRVVLLWFVGWSILGAAYMPSRLLAQAKEKATTPVVASKPPGGRGWTLDEALAELKHYPRDVYLQYVALQLAQRDDRLGEVAPTVMRLAGRDIPDWAERAEGVDLFNIFSGALAVQESLQIDAMTADLWRAPDSEFRLGRPGTRPQLPGTPSGQPARVKVASLVGPTIKSHPWKQMLGDRQPKLSPLANHVPADFYFVEFQSVTKFVDLIDQGDLWSRHLFSQSDQDATNRLAGERVKRQLAIETNRLARPFYDDVVERLAIAGSDLFLQAGSDVTLLFQIKHPDVFRPQMELYLKAAERNAPGARRDELKVLGVPTIHVTSADRSVHVFAAYPAPNLHLRSNSRAALERILAAIQGRDAEGKAVARLGESDEFAYIRSILPFGAPEEDGFVYLSDPFIRRMVGPKLKLGERRRMLCYNHLRMMSHANLLFRTEHDGKSATSIAELVAARCLPPKFGEAILACPHEGKYSLSADGYHGVCSVHGPADALVPNFELPLDEVTGEEAQQYAEFLRQYNEYWRTYFDPIALRIQSTPKRYRLETIVLPLIDNSIYTTLAGIAGDHPEELDALPVPPRNIFSVGVRLDKRRLRTELGASALLDTPVEAPAEQRDNARYDASKLATLGLALHNYHDTYGMFPGHVRFDDQGKRNRLSWRVHILPFLGESALYDQFKLDEPWDSPHNKKLLPQVPMAFSTGDEKLSAAGKTRFVAPMGEKLFLPSTNRKIRIADILDGLSNTVMVVESDDAHAVEWTKPDDLEIDLKKPADALRAQDSGAHLLLFADGAVHMVKHDIPVEKWQAIFTRDSGDRQNLEPQDEIRVAVARPWIDLDGSERVLLKQLGVGPLLAKGLGNQLSFHVYDTDPNFGFSLPSFLGRTLTWQRRIAWGDEMLFIAALIASLNSPVYLAVPVQDAEIVDAFLSKLDAFIREETKKAENWGSWFGTRWDFYHVTLKSGQSARAASLRLGPVTWRFFWARIGAGLYVATKPEVLDDVAALIAAAPAAEGDKGPRAHAMVRLRPQHWRQVLASYQLGWEENNRQACLHNVGPLTHLLRALSMKDQAGKPADVVISLQRLAGEIYNTHFLCPDGGKYELSEDGKHVECSKHGSAHAPRQTLTPPSDSSLGKLLDEFADMIVSLTFLEDGLHAVLTIDRK